MKTNGNQRNYKNLLKMILIFQTKSKNGETNLKKKINVYEIKKFENFKGSTKLKIC